MTDKRHLIDPIKDQIGDAWDDVLASFDGAPSAVRWLTRKAAVFDGKTPLNYLTGTPAQQQTAKAVLSRLDGVRIG